MADTLDPRPPPPHTLRHPPALFPWPASSRRPPRSGVGSPAADVGVGVGEGVQVGFGSAQQEHGGPKQKIMAWSAHPTHNDMPNPGQQANKGKPTAPCIIAKYMVDAGVVWAGATGTA
jgi:hypothetical protein